MERKIEYQVPVDFPPTWAGGWGEDIYGIYTEIIIRGIKYELRWIPPGEYSMGSSETEKGRRGWESWHGVKLTKGYWIGSTPCTQEQWQAVIGDNPSYFKGRQRPVEQVSWEDCRKFCERLNELLPGMGARLPTEAEWEYACRAGTELAFNDGSDCTQPEGEDPALDRLGWYDKNSGEETHPVGEKVPNAWGLYDMHGNVSEWCADCCDWTDNKIVTDTYLDGIADPVCKKGSWRVVRGGSYWNLARNCRSAGTGTRGSALP